MPGEGIFEKAAILVTAFFYILFGIPLLIISVVVLYPMGLLIDVISNKSYSKEKL